MTIPHHTERRAAMQPPSTVSSPHIRAAKRRFVLGLNLVSGFGFLVAAWQLYSGRADSLGLLLFLLMYASTGIGITVGYHRHFTHRSFRAPPWIRASLGVLGSMAGHGPLISWTATHRCHHQNSDRDGDPHSPNLHGSGWPDRIRGLWHAHMGWLLNSGLPNSAVYARHLLTDPLVRHVNRLYPFWVLLGLVLPALLGGLVTLSWSGALQGFLWGGLARLFVGFHATCSINSLTHAFGSRTFATPDQSRNSGLLAALTFGEGWHNNHHAFPSSARFGLRWWQLDPGFLTIRMLALLGLVANVKEADATKSLDANAS